MSEEELLKEARLQPLRKKLLQLRSGLRRTSSKQRADAPACGRTSPTRTSRGDVYRETYTGAERKWEANAAGNCCPGRRVYEELVREKPGDRDLRVALAGSWRSLMLIYWEDRDYEAGMSSTARVIHLWEQLRAEDPNNVNFGRMLGDSYSWRALLKRDTGDREGQAADIRRAVEIFQEILRIAPDDEATLGELSCRVPS